jgi:hypothetical protein
MYYAGLMTEYKHFHSPSEFYAALSLARHRYARFKAEREQEEREAAEQGFRPHYCIHGTNQWVDYDNICYGCEDGQTLLNLAVLSAKTSVIAMRYRMETIVSAWNDLEGVPGVTMDRQAMVTWAMDPIMY